MSDDNVKSERVKAVEEMIEETGRYGRAVQSISASGDYDTEGDFAFKSVVRVMLCEPRMRRYVLTVEQAIKLCNELIAGVRMAQGLADYITAAMSNQNSAPVPCITISNTEA